jgi:hypothetical protein
MQPQIWIGTIEIYYASPEAPSVWEPAFTTVTTWASNSEEFSQKCTRMLESYGWKLLGIDRANPVSDEDEFSEETEDMLERTKPIQTPLFTAHFIPTRRCETCPHDQSGLGRTM